MNTPAMGTETPKEFIARLTAEAELKRREYDALPGKERHGLENLAEGRKQLLLINPFLLEPEPGWNSRNLTLPENQEHILELAESIASEGVKEPLRIVFKDGRALIRNGELRWHAVMRAIEGGAPISAVPCLPANKHDSEADALVYQYLANKGKPFSASETAVHLRRLLNFMPPEKIAQRIGKSLSFVNNMLTLNAVPEEIKEHIEKGEIAPTEVLAVVTESHGNMREAAQRIEAAVQEAHAQGKPKATRRHVVATSPQITQTRRASTTTLRKVRDILDSCRIHEIDEGSAIQVVMTPADWDDLTAILGLSRQPTHEPDWDTSDESIGVETHQ